MEYTLKIDSFEGPLDLLLHFIKESKMNVLDLKIEIITNQYLEYIRAMKKLNLDIASSYLVMAAELLEIKSRLLLPQRKDIEMEEENPEEVLINRLIEYQRYKDLTEEFRDLKKERNKIFTKSPEKIVEFLPEVNIINNSDVTLDDLVNAFQNFLDRQKDNQPIPTKVTEKELTVEQRRFSIRKILQTRKKVNFLDLFEEITKEYVVVTFLAILEMARKEEIKITQENTFGDINVEVKD